MRPLLHFIPAEHPPCVWSPVDAFLYNLMTTNIAVCIAVPLVAAGMSYYYPSGSLVWAVAIAGAFCIVQAAVYAFLVSSIPRNGGDYVFQSRLLSGGAGTVFVFTGVILGGALWMALAAWLGSRVIVGPVLVLLGEGLRLKGVADVGTGLMSQWGMIALGLIVVLWSWFIGTRGMSTYARLQRRLVLVGFVALAVLLIYLAAVRLNIGVSTYRGIVYRAEDIGFRHQGHAVSWRAVMGLLPFVAFGLIHPGWVTFQAAEVRRAGELRVQFFAVVLSKMTSVAIALVLIPLTFQHLGQELFAASIYLLEHDPGSFWILAPRLLWLPGASWANWLIIGMLAVAVNVWFWSWVPTYAIAASRVMLSMSWDRVLPRWFAQIHAKRGTPTNAMLAFSCLSVAVVVAYSFMSVWTLALDAAVVGLLMSAVTCAAAALFPFLHRERYRESTAAPYEVGRVPVLTLAGLAFLAFIAALTWLYLSGRGVGVWDVAHGGLFLAAAYGSAATVHLVVRRYRQRHETPDIYAYYSDAISDERTRGSTMAAGGSASVASS